MASSILAPPHRRKILIGPQIRRLRKELALTQAEMARDLSVSPSYVNLIERNQRPISAELLVRLAQTYGVDFARFAGARGDDLLSELLTAFQDPVFAGAGVAREDAVEIAGTNPVLGEAVAALYRAWRKSQAELIELRVSGRSGERDPVEEARDFIHARRNHFPALDEIGESLQGDEDDLFEGVFGRLSRCFLNAHNVRVRIMPNGVMDGAMRRFERHKRELHLAETLDGASRTFHLALQFALFAYSSALDGVVNASKFETDAGRRLARAAVANYAAGAIMMPYGAFLAAARELRYDVEALGRRFGASFEQVAHRLTTLRRPDAEGVPFFFLRVDAAGNVSKRFAADVLPFARYGGSCPLWNVHDAFRAPRRILTQILQFEDGNKFFSIARTVQGEAGGFAASKFDRAVALGCAIERAAETVYAQELDLEAAPATPVGVTCRLCDRKDCAARAHPPLRRRLVVDEHRRFSTPFSFEFD